MKKGNMYEWAKPWNPLGGKCMHDCTYCSTNNLRRYPVIAYKYSGEPRLFSDLWKLPSKPQIIFVVAQNDLFANNIPTAYISRIIKQCKIWDRHQYFYQTKNPDRFLSFLPDFPKGSILCTTIETNRQYEQMGFAPPPAERAYAMEFISDFTKYVTIEPIMDFDLKEMVMLIKQCNPDSVNIGFDSKWNHLPEPNEQETIELITELRKFTKVKLKSNSKRIIKNKSLYL